MNGVRIANIDKVWYNRKMSSRLEHLPHDLEEISFQSLLDDPELRLQEGDIVTGLNSKQDFLAFERIIVGQMSGLDANEVHNPNRKLWEPNPRGRFVDIYTNPLPLQFVPKGFYGELRDGVALVTPQTEQTYEEIKSLGLSFLVGLASTGKGIIGQVQRDVQYVRSDSDEYSVKRILGPSTSIKAAESRIKLSQAYSSHIGRLIIARDISAPRPL
jgi:hypothetical protein